eukprot:9186449-Alexandrium_andersonii.AAC.1
MAHSSLTRAPPSSSCGGFNWQRNHADCGLSRATPATCSGLHLLCGKWGLLPSKCSHGLRPALPKRHMQSSRHTCKAPARDQR